MTRPPVRIDSAQRQRGRIELAAVLQNDTHLHPVEVDRDLLEGPERIHPEEESGLLLQPQLLERPATRERLASVLDVGALGRRLAAHRAGLADHAELLWACVVLDGFLARG